MKDSFPTILLARGRTAEVYEWGDGHVLKLFHNWFSLKDIQYEMKIAHAVHASGVKSPAVVKLIQVQGRNGLVYERSIGETLLAMFQRKPWNVVRYCKMLAQLHAQMHDHIFHADVPNQRAKLQHKISEANTLPASLKAALLKRINFLPEGDRICHGDFHPGNVLITDDTATIIDWIDASRGNPLADVARTSIILLGITANSQITNPIFKMAIQFIHSIYLREYFRLRPGGNEEYRQWLPIVAAARLNEGITEIEKWLIEQARQIS
jgi:uncharacterized protein (TIGR02172 family)